MIHDFDPSGADHHEACMCPCCDQLEQEHEEDDEEESGE